MANDRETYEVYALRYGGTDLQKGSRYHRYSIYNEPDQTVSMDFMFWMARNQNRTVLVDCGFDDVRTAQRGYLQDVHPVELLSRLDARPEDVTDVVISHMHFDHVGNTDLFPNATFHVAREELEFWTGPYGQNEHIGVAGDPIEIQKVADLYKEGRVNLVEKSAQILPGITTTTVRGHTAGSLVTDVSTAGGQMIFASDTIHWYEEMEKDRPFWLFCDLEGMLKGYDLLRTLGARPDSTIIAGHDPLVMSSYEAVADAVVDLGRPTA